MTAAEEFELAMACETAEDAQKVTEMVVSERTKLGMTESEAEAHWLQWVGYMAGFYNEAIRDKAETLFGAQHPVFGKLRPTEEENKTLSYISAKMGQDHAKNVAELLYARYLMTPPDSAK